MASRRETETPAKAHHRERARCCGQPRPQLRDPPRITDVTLPARWHTVTELVYPHQLKPVIQTGATVMNKLFGDPEPQPVVTHFVTQVQDAEEPTE